MLAEVTAPSAAQWAGFAAVASFLMVFVDKAPGLVRFFRGAPEKRTISFEAEFATKTELSKLESKVQEQESYGAERRKAIYKMIDDKSASTDAKLEAFRKEVKEDITELHEKVNDGLKEVSNEVSALSNNCQMTNASMAQIGTQITRLLERKSER